MRKNKFEKELCPGARTEFGCKVRQRPSSRLAKQRVSAERQIDQHRGARIARGGQQHAFRFAVAERVVDLEKIGLFTREHLCDRRVLSAEAGRHAEVAAYPLLFPFTHQSAVEIRITDIPRLHQVDAIRFQAAQRSLQRCRRGLAACVGRIFGREEKPVAQSGLRHDLADPVFRAAVRMRRVDQLAATRNKRFEDLPPLGLFNRIVLEIKYHRGADADNRQLLPAMRYRTGLDRLVRCRGVPAFWKYGGQRSIRTREKYLAAGEFCTAHMRSLPRFGAPPGTPASIIKYIHTATLKLSNVPETLSRLAADGAIASGS